jgi:DNA polymerase (family 10)
MAQDRSRPIAKVPRIAEPIRARSNADIAERFEEIAELLETQDANPFRVRAYRNAARTLRGYGSEVSDLIAQKKDLTEISGIGEDLARRASEFVKDGHITLLDQLRRQVPGFVVDLLRLPGIGPKFAMRLWRELGVRSLEQLRRAALDHRIRSMKGFGPKSEEKILEAIGSSLIQKRWAIRLAAPVATALLDHMRHAAELERIEIAGSYRRGRATVGDLDLLATTAEPQAVVSHFLKFAERQTVLAAGRTRATIILRSGLQIDLRVVPTKSYGAALQYLTGSKAHSIALRRLAMTNGLKISEYGVYRGQQCIGGDTEESVYAALGMPWIAPELRENRGEIEAACERRLPKLLERSDIRGDLHVHAALDEIEMVKALAGAAKVRDYSYVAIIDNARRLTAKLGEDLGSFKSLLERLAKSINGVHILKGIEVEIAADGHLELAQPTLELFDLVIASVRDPLGLSRDDQTRRVLAALDQPQVTILSHPSSLNAHEAAPDRMYDVDMHRLIRAAADHECFLELTADPDRIDLGETYCPSATAQGVLISVSSEARATNELANMDFAVLEARRGWLEADGVLNTLSFTNLVTKLARRRHEFRLHDGDGLK